MTKIRKPLSEEFILSYILTKIDEDEIKSVTGKTISHFRKCSDPDDQEHHIHFSDCVKLDLLMQRKKLGTPFLDNYALLMKNEHKKVNEFDNILSILANIGGRVGHLMDTTNEAMQPTSEDGQTISNTEKDEIYKSILDVEEKIAKLKITLK